MKHHPVLDVAELPTYAMGHRSPMWWGTLGFCALEGTGFALAVGACLYLAFLNPQWPLSAPPPDLIWSSLLAGLLLLSLVPNWLTKKAGEAEDKGKTQIMLVVMSVIGLAASGGLSCAGGPGSAAMERRSWTFS